MAAKYPNSSMPWPIIWAGVQLIAESETCSLKAYLCPAGVPTIGWGETKGIRLGMTWTQQEADQALVDSLCDYVFAVQNMLTVPTDEHELAAMVSLAYNIGLQAFRGSTVLRKHNQGDREAAARAFLLWNKAKVGGKLVVLPGLATRRARESALFLQVDDHIAAEAMPQAVAAETSLARSPIAQSGAATAAAGALAVASQVSETVGGVAAQAAQTAHAFGVSPVVIIGAGLVAAGGVALYWRHRQRDQGWA